MSRLKDYLGSFIVILISLAVLLVLVVMLETSSARPDEEALEDNRAPITGDTTENDEEPAEQEWIPDESYKPEDVILPDIVITPENKGYVQVIGTQLYDTNAASVFHMVGINMDNNIWDTEITPGNRCMDETSYAEIKAMGFNTVRFPISFHMVQYEEFYPWLDENIKWAKEAGLYIELDMHSSQGGIQIREKEAAYEFWNSKSLRNEFKEQWVEIAKRYADETAVIAYDLLNEPLVIIEGEKEEAEGLYFSYMQELIDAIRAVDSNHIICVEEFTIELQDKKKDEVTTVYPDMNAYVLNDMNLVYDCHAYSPSVFVMQEPGEKIEYDDTYIIRGETWISNLAEVRNKSITKDSWTTLSSGVSLLEDTKINAGVVKIEIKNATSSDGVMIDEMLVYEYDNKKQFVDEVYRIEFDKSGYVWSESGKGTYSIEDGGTDGSVLYLRGFSSNKNYVIKQTAKSANGMFPMTPGHYYKVICKIKTTNDMKADSIRVSIAGYQAEFSGSIAEYLEYNFDDYLLKMKSRRVPVICNETGCTYTARQNGGYDWLNETVEILNDYGINYCLFAYTGKDFGLMYDSNRGFGTDECKLRQDSYDALYNILHPGENYDHVFKNMDTLENYTGLSDGDKVLILGKEYAGVGTKLVYTIQAGTSGHTIRLNNGFYAVLSEEMP